MDDGYNGSLARSWTQNSEFSSLGDVGSLQNGLFKNQFEVENASQKEKEIEVRILRRALNLPVGPFTGTASKSHASSRLSNSTTSPTTVFIPPSVRNISSPARTCDVTDSGYSSNKPPNLATGSLNLLSGTNLPQDEPLSPPGSIYTSGGSLPQSQTFTRSLKESLEESESKRLQLLQKMREAHLTIQNQSERLASAESESCYLRGQIKSMSIEQEGFQQELDSLTTEKKALESIRSESNRNRELFLARINELDQQLKILNHTHNAVQVEYQQKSAVLEQASLTLTFLEEENNRLQLSNEDLLKEISSTRQSVEELVASRQRQEEEKNQAYQELEKLKQVHQVLVLQQSEKDKKLTTTWKLTEELKTKQDMMEQEMTQLRLERDVAHGKLSVLEGEAQHVQESSAEVHKEKEQLIRSNVEMEQRLQQLDFVNDLLRKESSNVKEAFQKAEELNKLLKKEQEKTQREKTALKSEISGLKEKVRRIRESYEKEKAKRIRLPGDEEGPTNSESSASHDQLVAYRDRLRAKCRELQNQVDTLKAEVRKLRKAKEEDKELLKLSEAQKDALAKQQSSVTRKLEVENKQLQQRLQSSNEVTRDLGDLKEKHQRILEENAELREEIQESENAHAQLKEQKEDLKKENENLALEVSKLKEQELQNVELEQIREDMTALKENVSGLEADKLDLVSQLQKLQNEQEAWTLQKSELQMSHAELEAENEELRAAVHDRKGADASNSEEIANLKTELKKMQETLKTKDELVENQGNKLQQKTAKTNKEPTEDRHISKFPRRNSDGSIDRLEMHPAAMSRAWRQLKSDFEQKVTKNVELTNQVREVVAERDLALSEIEDLRDGMQQLKEAFEEECEKELESQQSAFRQERELILQEQQERMRESSQQMSDTYLKIEQELRKLSQEKLALETRNKNLECDRDELRGQIEELCKMRAGAVNKAVQVDIIQSPKRKDSRATPPRKRSYSTNVPVITVEEMLDSPTEGIKTKSVIPEEPAS